MKAVFIDYSGTITQESGPDFRKSFSAAAKTATSKIPPAHRLVVKRLKEYEIASFRRRSHGRRNRGAAFKGAGSAVSPQGKFFPAASAFPEFLAIRPHFPRREGLFLKNVLSPSTLSPTTTPGTSRSAWTRTACAPPALYAERWPEPISPTGSCFSKLWKSAAAARRRRCTSGTPTRDHQNPFLRCGGRP